MATPNQYLSKREKEVVKFLLEGKSNKQIAFALGIADSTVEFHLKNVYGKLGVNSRAEAILKLNLPSSDRPHDRRATFADSNYNPDVTMREKAFAQAGFGEGVEIGGATFSVLKVPSLSN